MQDLPTWAYALITTTMSCALTTVIAFIVNRMLKKRVNNYDHTAELARKQEEYEKKREIKDIITNSIQPVINHVEKIDSKIDGLKDENNLENKATVIMIRLKLMEWHDVYMARGYCDIKERSTWEELFIKYGELGGNHFKEYMNQIREDIQKLPMEKPVKKRKK